MASAWVDSEGLGEFCSPLHLWLHALGQVMSLFTGPTSERDTVTPTLSAVWLGGALQSSPGIGITCQIKSRSLAPFRGKRGAGRGLDWPSPPLYHLGLGHSPPHLCLRSQPPCSLLAGTLAPLFPLVEVQLVSPRWVISLGNPTMFSITPKGKT